MVQFLALNTVALVHSIYSPVLELQLKDTEEFLTREFVEVLRELLNAYLVRSHAVSPII